MLTALSLLAKLCLYLGAIITIGVISHHLMKIRASLKGLRLGLSLLAIGLVAKLLLANAQINGGLQQLLNFDNFHWVWLASKGQVGFLIFGLILSLVAIRLNHKGVQRLLFTVAILSTSASFAMTGHTQGQEDAPFLYLWMMPHVLIAGFWVMAPFSLWPDSVSDDQKLIVRVERFSRAAIWMVPVLLLTGAYVLWQLLPQLSDLWTTAYGQLLSIKLIAITCLLGLGAWNKFRVTRMLKHNILSGRVHLKRSLGLETLLFTIVIIVILFATTVTGPGSHAH